MYLSLWRTWQADRYKYGSVFWYGKETWTSRAEFTSTRGLNKQVFCPLSGSDTLRVYDSMIQMMNKSKITILQENLTKLHLDWLQLLLYTDNKHSLFCSTQHKVRENLIFKTNAVLRKCNNIIKLGSTKKSSIKIAFSWITCSLIMSEILTYYSVLKF